MPWYVWGPLLGLGFFFYKLFRRNNIYVKYLRTMGINYHLLDTPEQQHFIDTVTKYSGFNPSEEQVHLITLGAIMKLEIPNAALAHFDDFLPCWQKIVSCTTRHYQDVELTLMYVDKMSGLYSRLSRVASSFEDRAIYTGISYQMTVYLDEASAAIQENKISV